MDSRLAINGKAFDIGNLPYFPGEEIAIDPQSTSQITYMCLWIYQPLFVQGSLFRGTLLRRYLRRKNQSIVLIP